MPFVEIVNLVNGRVALSNEEKLQKWFSKQEHKDLPFVAVSVSGQSAEDNGQLLGFFRR